MSEASEGAVGIESERPVPVAGHTCRRTTVSTPNSELTTFVCVECDTRSNTVAVFDRVDCETGELDRPTDESETDRRRDDMRTQRDVAAIVEALEDNESVTEIETPPTERDSVSGILVRLDGTPPSTRDLEAVRRNHDLKIGYTFVSPTGELLVGLVPTGLGGFDV
jgi:hypothetical protein